MVLFDPRYEPGFVDYGILIPVHHSRATRTCKELKNHPLLSQRVEEWLTSTITRKLEKEDLLRVHDPRYVDALFSPDLENQIFKTFELIKPDGTYHRYDPETAKFPLSALFEKLRYIAGGTTQGAFMALERGFCFYFGGGMHHAHRDEGKGFCLMNDVVIGVRTLQAEGKIKTAWVIDVDAHKGDGTAALTRGDDTVITLSVHMARGWPLDENPVYPDGRPNPSFIPSDIDIPIETGEEPQYVRRLEEGLRHMEEEHPLPDLAIVVDGSDPFEEDELPSTTGLRLSLEQMFERDMLIYNFLTYRKTPTLFVMAGGYGKNSWKVYTRFLTTILPGRL